MKNNNLDNIYKDNVLEDVKYEFDGQQLITGTVKIYCDNCNMHQYQEFICVKENRLIPRYCTYCGKSLMKNK